MTGAIFRPFLALLILAVAALFLQAESGSRDSDPPTLVFSEKDQGLQSSLEEVLSRAPFRDLVERNELSVALVDLSDPEEIRYAGVRDDRMRYAASLPKIAILVAAFDQIDKGHLSYTPKLKKTMVDMIRRSSNKAATQLIKSIGFETISEVLRDPRYELYDLDRKGGLWVGRDYGGKNWKRDPLNQISHGATARQVARFLVMLNRDMLVSPWACAEMKDILSRPGIHHKFVKGLQEQRPGSRIYRKSGTWKTWHSDAALIERDGKKYVAVALMVSSAKQVLSRLIVQLDDIIHNSPDSESSS